MAYDGKLKFDTGIDTSGFQLGLDGLSSMASKGLNLLSSSFSATFEGIKKAGSGIWDFMSESVSVGADFESSLSNTMGLMSSKYKQGTEEYAQALDTLSTKAQDLGASTQFSASQVSDAFGYMALAGWDVEQQTGAIDGVLNLAASSGMELASASDMVTDYLSAFSMKADQAGYFADMLAYSSTNSNTSVEQLGEAYKNCAANMNASGQSVETTTALLSKMADQGEKGSTAGTKLTAIMRDLKNSCENGAIAVGDTSVAVYDAQGNMRDLGEIMVDIQKATKTMTSEQRDLALGSSFTADSIAGVNLILNAGADSVVEFSNELKGCKGTAEEVANTMNDNLAGDITSMQSAFEGLQIALSQYLNDDLRTIVQNATGYLATLRKSFLDGGWENLGSAIGKTVKNAINDNRGIVSKYMTLGTRMIIAITDGISENSDFITKSLGTMISQAVTSGSTIYSNVYTVGLKLITGIAESIANNSNKIINELLNNIGDISGSLLNYTPKLLQAGLTIIQAILQGMSSNSTLTAMTNQMILLVNSLATCIKDNLSPILSAGLDVITAIIDGISLNAENLFWSAFNIVSLLCNFILENLPTLVNVAIGIIQSIGQFISENSFILVTSAMLLINQLGTFIIENLPVLLDCAIEILNSLINFISENLSLFINCAVQILLVLANALIENLPTLISYIPMLVTSIADVIISNLPMLLNVAVQLLMILVNGIIDNVSVLFNATIMILNTLIDMIVENLPMLIDASIEIVITLMNGILDNLDQLIDASLGLLNQLIDSVIENLPLLIDCALQIVTKLADEIANNFPTIVEKGGELVQKLINGVLDAKDKAVEGAKELINNIWNTIQDTDWLSLGKNILSGIANGLWEGLQNIGETISSVADNILQSFKDFFGIASPSKLLRDEIGKFMPQGIAIGFDEETPNAIDDMNRTLNSQITGIDIDGIYSQLQGLNYSQGVPSYSGVVQSAYKSSGESSQQSENGGNQGTIVVENYLFKNSQKLNSMVINAGVLENARSGGNSI